MTSVPARPEGSTARSWPAVTRQVGDTPLLRLEAVTKDLPDRVTLYAKGEHLNPGGSVKDRPALRMIREGLRSGALTDDRTLIDATSGNTGIAYALLGAALDLPVELALPENASPERKHILRAYGARLIFTDPLEGTDGAQRVVRERVTEQPDRYFYPDQYSNEANWQAHYEGTGPEILAQAESSPTHFVAGLGTTGTFVGVARRLKATTPSVQCCAVQPDGPMHGLEGLKHLETARVPAIYDDQIADRVLHVDTDEGHAMTRRLAREEGLLVGPSSGANVAAALRVARTLSAGAVVTVLCDTGTRYLSDDFWNDA